MRVPPVIPCEPTAFGRRHFGRYKRPGKTPRSGRLMELVELRDLDEARQYVLQGLWLQRVVTRPRPWSGRPWSGRWRSPPAASRCRRSGSSPTSGTSPSASTAAGSRRNTAESPAGRRSGPQLRGPRARQALRRLDVRAGRPTPSAGTQGRDQAKGLAYVVNQIRERAGIGGVDCPRRSSAG